nr:hypothetical protein DMOBY_00770 [Dehalococcoides mccartyi]
MFSSIGKLALDDAPVAVYWLNNCGEIVYSNKVFAKMIGYSTEELSRMNICEISSNFTHS